MQRQFPSIHFPLVHAALDQIERKIETDRKRKREKRGERVKRTFSQR